MNGNAAGQILLFLGVLVLVSKPLGLHIYKIMDGASGRAGRWLAPVERALYRCCGIDATEEMTWSSYSTRLLAFNVLGGFILYLLQRVQGMLPLNPASYGAVAADGAFNTAVSFVTNTSWQSYAG